MKKTILYSSTKITNSCRTPQYSLKRWRRSSRILLRLKETDHWMIDILVIYSQVGFLSLIRAISH